MQSLSLQNFIENMAQNPTAWGDLGREDARADRPQKATSEKDMLIELDPLAQDLHKHHQTAFSKWTKLKDKHGVNDPMTQVAADMVDSTEAALETRLIEMREDDAIMAMIREREAQQKDEEERVREITNKKQNAIRQRIKDFLQRQKDDSLLHEEDAWFLYIIHLFDRYYLSESFRLAKSAPLSYSFASANTRG